MPPSATFVYSPDPTFTVRRVLTGYMYPDGRSEAAWDRLPSNFKTSVLCMDSGKELERLLRARPLGTRAITHEGTSGEGARIEWTIGEGTSIKTEEGGETLEGGTLLGYKSGVDFRYGNDNADQRFPEVDMMASCLTDRNGRTIPMSTVTINVGGLCLWQAVEKILEGKEVGTRLITDPVKGRSDLSRMWTKKTRDLIVPSKLPADDSRA